MAALPTDNAVAVGKLGCNHLGAPSSPWGTNWTTKDEEDQKTKQLAIEGILGNVILRKSSSHMVAPLAPKDHVLAPPASNTQARLAFLAKIRGGQKHV